ncbi:MAG: CotH kinase family protein, partial [Oscillospiraceae bacterium]|nr:CotH kinase family protein [Oscillospiraceae bacterium]
MNKKTAALTVSALLAIVFAVLLLRGESRRVLGVPFAAEDLTATERDAVPLTWNGVAAPYDAYTDTWYLPQSLDRAGWDGVLAAEDGWRLYWAEDEWFSYRPSAVEYCHGFTLLAQKDGRVSAQTVVFTGLPALCAEDGRIRLLCPDASGDKGARTVTSFGTLTVRGYESDLWPKASYKLTLTGPGGEYFRTQLLGMRPDDDWLLLPLYNDRTKLREKLAMDLWNELAAADPYALETGAAAEYVELFVDGDYRWLYLLAQRLDAKLTGADADDTVYLFDGPDLPTREEFSLTRGFFCRDVEIRSTHPYYDASLWNGAADWTEAVFGGGAPAAVPCRTGNLCDVLLFCRLVSAPRFGFQSFVLVDRDHYGQRLCTVIPTDFKYSFGSGWSETALGNYTAFSEEPFPDRTQAALTALLGDGADAALAGR